MKKTFALTAPGHANARVVESVKHEVRKYVKRERKKPLPADFDLWDFSCKVGADQATAESKDLREVGNAIDAVVSAGGSVVYIEVLSVPSRRSALARVPNAEAPVTTPREPGID
jgi:hypothetical protein